MNARPDVDPAQVRSHFHQPWVSSVAANFAARFCALLSAVVVARVLGPEGRGVLAAAMLWPTMVEHGSVINLPTVTYFGAKHGSSGLKTCVWLGLMMAIVLVPVSLAVNWIVFKGEDGSQQYANWFTLIIPLAMAGTIVGGTLLAEQRVGAFWSTRLTTTFVTAVAVPILAAFGLLSVGSYLATFLLATLAGVLLAARLQTMLTGPSERNSGALAPKVVRFGGRTLITSMAAQLNMRLDQLAISIMLPAAVLGQYVVAFSWASAVYVVSSALATVVLSRTSHSNILAIEEREAAVARIRRTGIFSVCVAIAVAALAPVAIPFIFGDEYHNAVAPAILLALAAGAIGWKGLLHEFARGTGSPSTGRLPELVGLAVRAVGLAALLSAFGGVGAGVAALMSATAIMATFIARLARTVDISPRSFVPTLADLQFVLSAATNYVGHHRERIRGTFFR